MSLCHIFQDVFFVFIIKCGNYCDIIIKSHVSNVKKSLYDNIFHFLYEKAWQSALKYTNMPRFLYFV